MKSAYKPKSPNAGGTSFLNQFKHGLASVSEGLPAPEFKPLRSYPATNHPRQAEIDAFRDLPSRYV
ncbi:MAG: hypothetical protein M0Z99_32220 [Betaproteobacteria bacterium]|nr:hypothetical protein [Betaproteobacteria bacterium]